MDAWMLSMNRLINSSTTTCFASKAFMMVFCAAVSGMLLFSILASLLEIAFGNPISSMTSFFWALNVAIDSSRSSLCGCFANSDTALLMQLFSLPMAAAREVYVLQPAMPQITRDRKGDEVRQAEQQELKGLMRTLSYLIVLI